MGPVLGTEDAIAKKKKRAKGKGGRVAALAKPAAKVRDYEAHVLVCAGGDCKKRGAKETRKALKGELRSRGLLGEVRTDTTSCLGLCKHGPNVVVYDGADPGGTWYLGLDEGGVPEVVEDHLLGGAPVPRLAAGRRPRKTKK